MAEVQAFREEILDPQVVRKMVRIIRDKEMASIQKVRVVPIHKLK